MHLYHTITQNYAKTARHISYVRLLNNFILPTDITVKCNITDAIPGLLLLKNCTFHLYLTNQCKKYINVQKI